ncbi:MAG: hypothetical protein AAF902_00990 [Chloroflexota bacterium]
MEALKKNRTQLITLAVLAFLFFTAIQGMETKDWVITVLRGLSVGAVTFLVASGLSLILGLMDVLNLAHGEMFMVGAYVGWTVFVRPDTVVDVIPPLALLCVGLFLIPVWRVLWARWANTEWKHWAIPAGVLLVGLAILSQTMTRFPITIWDPEQFAISPGTFALSASQGNLQIPAAVVFESSAIVAIIGTLLGGMLVGLAITIFQMQQQSGMVSPTIPSQPLIIAGSVGLFGLLVHWLNTPVTNLIVNMPNTGRFFLAMLVATLVGGAIGWLIERSLIRPLYDRPIYQLMLTLGLAFISVEIVRAIWGRPEFTMPKPDIFTGSGDFCPATNIGDLIAYNCSTILLFDGRIRTYNEVFVIAVGVVVLIAVWILLQRTRIGMIIRAGVQDSEMVEALGINVRQVFTFVFALGVALATLGGVLAAPSMGLSTAMGGQLLLLALIALAIGGLTSFPGAAAGAVLVGLLQQFLIKYGQIGIDLPFLAEPFKPSPPLVPSSTVMLMVIILLVLPNGLFGRNEG